MRGPGAAQSTDSGLLNGPSCLSTFSPLGVAIGADSQHPRILHSSFSCWTASSRRATVDRYTERVNVHAPVRPPATEILADTLGLDFYRPYADSWNPTSLSEDSSNLADTGTNGTTTSLHDSSNQARERGREI